MTNSVAVERNASLSLSVSTPSVLLVLFFWGGRNYLGYESVSVLLLWGGGASLDGCPGRWCGLAGGCGDYLGWL